MQKNKDYKYFKKPLEKKEQLISYNKPDINNFIYWISSENGNQNSNMNQIKSLKNKGVNLLQLIKSEIE